MKSFLEKIVLAFVNFLYKFSNFILDLFKFLFFYQKRIPKDIKKILIFRIGNIGDIICSVPSMVAIRENFPKAKIILLSSPGKHEMIGAEALLKNAEFLNGNIIYYQEEIKALKGKHNLIRRLKKEKFDLFIELPQNLTKFSTEIRNLVFAKLIGVKYAFGFRINTIRIFRRIQSKYLKFDNEVERILKILKRERLKVEEVLFSLPISEEDKERVSNFLIELNNRNVIALNPIAKRQPNLWPLDRFAEVGRWLIKNYNVKIVAIGDERDGKKIEQLKEMIGEGAINVTNRFTLLQTIELLRYCQLLISGDTGAVHMASAVGVPIIGIYSARDFKNKWSPYGEKNIVLRKEPRCHLCFSESCKDTTCLKMIGVEEVCKAVEGLFSKGLK